MPDPVHGERWSFVALREELTAGEQELRGLGKIPEGASAPTRVSPGL